MDKKAWLVATSVFSVVGTVVLAITFYFAFMSGSGSVLITINGFGEMYVEALLIMPFLAIMSLANPILAFRIWKDGASL